jgi:hypothetical protein
MYPPVKLGADKTDVAVPDVSVRNFRVKIFENIAELSDA